MKKISYLLSAALITFCVSCGEEDNSVNQQAKPVGNTQDFVSAVAKGGVVTLAPDAKITLTEALVVTKPVEIVGNEESDGAIIFGEKGIITSSSVTISHVTLNAEKLTTPLIQFAPVSVEEGESVKIDKIEFNDADITNLSCQLIYANKQPYLVSSIIVENSIIEIGNAVKKTIFDFNGGGNTELLSINNSTIYGNPENTTWQNGGFFSSQSGKEVTDLGGETTKLSITNSTLYYITSGVTVNTLRKNNQAHQFYVVKNNIIVNCGKKGQFLAGLAAGNISKKANWDAQNNIINWIENDNVEDLSVAENTKAGLKDLENNIPDPVWDIRITTFADLNYGDFSQSTTTIGDPRWIEQ